MKKCASCKRTREDSEFYERSENGRPFSHCKECCKLRQAVYRESDRFREKVRLRLERFKTEHPEKFRLQQRSRGLKHRFGITLTEYYEMAHQQGNVCAICGKPETRKMNRKVAELCVDHSHNFGHVRGLLCASCNTGLGAFKDDKDLLQNALVYLLFND